jgi:hypothetical protein
MAPHVQRTDDFAPGDFSFIQDPIKKEMLTHDYQAIDQIQGAWKFLKKYPNEVPLVFSDNLWKELSKSYWNKHTSDTLGKSMSTMRFIAKQGWEDYVFLVRD